MSEQNEKLTAAEEFGNVSIDVDGVAMLTVEDAASIHHKQVEHATAELREELGRQKEIAESLAKERWSLRDELSEAQRQRDEARKYKLLFDLTQMGWKISLKQQPLVTYLNIKYLGFQLRLVLNFEEMEWRNPSGLPIFAGTLRVLHSYGFRAAKLPNQ